MTATAMRRPASTVQRIHFEDFGGAEFERLVFAYHVRAGWKDLEWYGQTGSDQGRDIVGVEILDRRTRRRAVIQCVNRSRLTLSKANTDMKKAVAASADIKAFRFVCRANISAQMRDAVRVSADAMGIKHVSIWSGVEFEEHLRLTAETLLRRFCAGESFPDDADGLKSFAADYPDLSDRDALALIAAVFDRPAFTTPFHCESSLGAFQTAIEDTISALNTGIWRTREGEEIRRIPSRHILRSPTLRGSLDEVTIKVDQLRRLFVTYLRSGEVKRCGCGDPDCPTFMISDRAMHRLNDARCAILESFRRVKPDFEVSFG